MEVWLEAAAGTLLPPCPMGKVPSGHAGPARAVPASSCRLEIPMSCCKTITKENNLKSGLQLRNLGLSAMVAGGPPAGGWRQVSGLAAEPAVPRPSLLGMGHHLGGAAGVSCGGIRLC